MAVLLVVCRAEFEVGGLRAALTADARAGALLLADNRLDLQFAELYVCAKAEEAAHTWNEADVAGEGDVAGFDEFDDFVFLAVVFEFEVLGVVVEGGLCVVVEVHVDFVAHLAVEAEIDFLVEVKSNRFAARSCEGRVVHLLRVDAHLEFCAALRLDLDAARAEDFLSRSEVEVHVCEVELVLAFCLESLCVLLSPVLLHRVLQRPFLVFLWSHQDWRVQETGCCAQREACPAGNNASG